MLVRVLALVASLCVVGVPAAAAAAAAPDRARVVVTGAVRLTETRLRGCDVIALARTERLLVLRFAAPAPALLSVRLISGGPVRDASVARAWVTFAVPRRIWATGPFPAAHGRPASRGSGVVSLLDGGRRGTVRAGLPGTRDAGTRVDLQRPAVHVDASWSCPRLPGLGRPRS